MSKERKKKVQSIICEYCGKIFNVNSSRIKTARYCSKECYSNAGNDKRYIRKKIKCKQCGIIFIVSNNRRNTAKFCSKKCFYAYGNKKLNGANNHLWHGGKIKKKCLNCGNIFESHKSTKRKYCSKECCWKSKYTGGVSESLKRRKNNLKNDKKHSIKMSMSNSIRKALHKKNSSKNGYHWEVLVGYTCEKLMRHLESQFAIGMSWDNYGNGGWHIDHKIPVSVFNFTDVSHLDFKRCWALENLQPLWAKENLKKGAKLEQPFQPSLMLGI